MKTLINNFLVVLFVAATMVACKEKDNDKAPSVTIGSPTDNQNFNAGAVVHINADLNHTSDIHEYSVIIKAVANDSVVFNHMEHIHMKNYHVHEHWTNNLDFSSDMLLTVTAVDHEGVMTSKSVSFHCHH